MKFYELLPVLVPGVAILIVHLDPLYGLCQPFNPQIRIPIETCITYIFEKNELLPVLVPGVAVLIVHLDPQFGICHPCDLEIWIPIKDI